MHSSAQVTMIFEKVPHIIEIPKCLLKSLTRKSAKVGINGDGWRLDLGGEHTINCTDDVLWNCVPEACIILFKRGKNTSIESKKKKINCN